MKRGVKDIVAPQGLFEDLGLKYLGPVDGHDIEALEHVLHRAAEFDGPVIVHAITQKGRGYGPAEQDEADRFHGVGVIDPETGRPRGSGAPSWTSVFADEMVAIGAEQPEVVAITAAMLNPVGLGPFADSYPERCFDVGIAEQHAVTSATGMALAGLHPVVALYATFLNRAFDQVLLDAALHEAPVTFVLDRAGITGDDGASHNGMWDLSVLQIVPNLRIAVPRDAIRLREQLRQAIDDNTGPTVVRFPKGAVIEEIPAVGRVGDTDLLAEHGPTPDVLLVAVGPMAQIAMAAAQRLADQGIGSRVIDPGWVSPVPTGIVAAASDSDVVAVVEDNGRVGGVGSRIALALADAGVDRPFREFGVPQTFLPHSSRADLMEQSGLTAADIAAELVALVSRRTDQEVADAAHEAGTQR